jgi:hypothetical protein
MFKEELGIATTSRCEQYKVQYFQEDTKTKFLFYNFFCTCGFSTFSIWVPFECKQKNQGVHLFVLGGLGTKDHGFMNARILSNPHARQKWNEKKALD